MTAVYRCPSGHLVFGRVRADSLFGLCRTCRLHRPMTIADDPEALRWQQVRANQTAAVLTSDGSAAQVGVPAAIPPGRGAPADSDPFFPTGTDW